MIADYDSLRRLPIAEKLYVIQVLWDDISSSNEEIVLPPGLHEEIQDRIAEYDADPSSVMTREELWNRVDELRG